MITIKKTGEGYYLAFITNLTEELDRNSCYHIKKELSVVIKPHREITFNLKGVKLIDNGGLKALQETLELGNLKKCKIRFINVDPLLSDKITSIKEKSTHGNPREEISLS